MSAVTFPEMASAIDQEILPEKGISGIEGIWNFKLCQSLTERPCAMMNMLPDPATRSKKFLLQNNSKMDIKRNTDL